MERTTTIKIEPTPEELAECFCNMDANQQARFFNAVADVSGKWKNPFCFQLQAITEKPILSASGRTVMAEIGNYAFQF